MNRSKSHKWTCLVRLAGVGLIGLVVLFVVGLKLHSDTLIRRAEAKYPPSEFVTVEGVRPSAIKNSVAESSIILPAWTGLSRCLDEIKGPVIIVAGGFDDHTIEAVSRLEEDLLHTRVIIVEDANH